MNEMQVFNYNSTDVRTVVISGEPWFVLKDVCGILGMDTTQLKKIADRLEADEKGRTQITTPGGAQETWIINESGLYNVVLRSDKPEAKPFRKWVTSEVLPTIRKTGGYVNNDDLFISTYLPNADEATTTLFRSTLAAMRSLNAKIEEDKPKVLFADSVAASKTSILVGDLAKLLRQNGVNIGQNRLFEWLRQNKYLCSTGERRNMPTQRSMDMALFEVKETTINNADGSVRTTRTTKVTGKGQAYFINAFLGDSKGVS